MVGNFDIKYIAIVGGSCAGKTTLVEELGRRGFATICEAALVVIDELTIELGMSGIATWRESHFDTLQWMIGRKQVELEDLVVPKKGDWVFCDGGLLDPVGYCMYFGVTPPSDLDEIVSIHRRYFRVFVLESLSAFVPRLKAGRTSDRHTSFEIGILLEDLYHQRGYEVIKVPEMSIAMRADYILEQL